MRVLDGQRRTNLGKEHFLMEEFDLGAYLATVVAGVNFCRLVGDVLTELLRRNVEDDGHIRDFQIDRGESFYLFKLLFRVSRLGEVQC